MAERVKLLCDANVKMDASKDRIFIDIEKDESSVYIDLTLKEASVLHDMLGFYRSELQYWNDNDQGST